MLRLGLESGLGLVCSAGVGVGVRGWRLGLNCG